MITESQKQDATVLLCMCCHWLAIRNKWMPSEEVAYLKCRMCDAEYRIEELMIFREDGTTVIDYCEIDQGE